MPGGVGVFARLNDRIATTVRNARTAGLSEIECLIEADDALHYQHVIQAVAAISARRNELGEVEPLIRKIKFPQAVQTEIVDR